MASIDSNLSLNSNTFCTSVVVPAIERLNEANIKPTVGVLDALSTNGINQGVLKPDSTKERPSPTSGRKLYTRSETVDCNQSSTPVDLCNLPAIANNYVDNRKLVEHAVELSVTRTIPINAEEFKKYCDTPDDYFQRRIKELAPGVLKEINEKLSVQLIGYMGSYFGQTLPATSITNSKALSFFNQNYNGQAFVKNEYALLGHTMADPVYIGGEYISHLKDSQTRLVGYNRDGYTTPAIQNAFVDFGIDTLINIPPNKYILTFLPETFVLLNYNDINEWNSKYKGSSVIEKNVLDVSPFGDPFSWDYMLQVDASGCNYQVTFQTYFDLGKTHRYNCAGATALAFIAQCTENNCPV